jgi:hypothetical protein
MTQLPPQSIWPMGTHGAHYCEANLQANIEV